MQRPAIIALLACVVLVAAPALAQQAAPPPAVGVVSVERQSVTRSNEYVGRIQATERVNLVARVTGFLDQRFFTEGAEVKKGDLLYRMEQGPFQADVQAKQAAIAQINAQLQNATLTLNRAKALLTSPAGQQSVVDTAVAGQQSLQAQLQAAQAQLRQSQINLAYTELHAPVDGKIGRSTTTTGNVVGPGSGVLATIVSQDPIYVVFPVSVRAALELRQRYAGKGGFTAAVLKVKLPDGRVYGPLGKLDFIDNTIAGTTDSITLRGVIANPPLSQAQGGDGTMRELVDDELVTVVVEDAAPAQALAIPRSAVLSDQQGDFVYVVDAQNKAQRQRIELGQSTPTMAVVTKGLDQGQTVVVEGIQRVRAGEAVSPGPAAGSAVPAQNRADAPPTDAPPAASASRS